ncbi:NADH:ubiquinone oxidoreductase, 24 kDa subunit [Candidatus Magnetoovum chiemensis]|nr:NADH:ubiquinone oxidoreductase, 24 kDa subunit [Candidatus Magnetoovum chiemensis]
MSVTDINIDEVIGNVSGILGEYEKKKGILITTLHRIQEEEGYLPEYSLRQLSHKIGLSLAEIYSVASFYKQFHFKPRGKKIVRVCTGTACHVRGASKVVDGLEGHFHIKAGNTTEDRKMTLETVGCVGCCGLAPVVTVNEDVVGAVGVKKLKDLIKDIDQEQGNNGGGGTNGKEN